MSDAGARKRRANLGILWLATLFVGICAVVDFGEGDDGQTVTPQEDTSSQSPDEKLKIASVSDAQVNPGDAIVVTVQGLSPADATPVKAVISKKDADILSRQGDRLVVRIPRDLDIGKASIRVAQGARRSKPHDLLVRPVRTHKVARDLLGGIALVVVGLSALSLGLRGLAGRQLRTLLASWTQGSVRAVTVGALLGGLTQVTTSAVGVILGFLKSRLLGLGPAIAVLWGAQLGAVVLGAIIPFTLMKESLFLIAIGAVWTAVNLDRKTDAIGQAILGAGFLLYGLYLFHDGAAPLLANTVLFEHVGRVQQSLLLCTAAGVLLSALLQGPLPLFGLVVGVVQSTGVLGFENALAVLAGAGFGTALIIAAIAWPSGHDGRRLAIAHLVLGIASSAAMLAAVPLWAFLADKLVPGNPEEVVYGKRILLPNMSAHLATGFFVAQALVTVLFLPILTPLTRWVQRRSSRVNTPALFVPQFSGNGSTAAATEHVRHVLAEALRRDLRGLEALRELCFQGDRDRALVSEMAFRNARIDIEQLFITLGGPGHAASELEVLQRTIITTLQLQLTLDDLLRLAERGVEENLLLADNEKAALSSLHELVVESLDSLIVALERGSAPNLEDARAREIELNAREAEARHALFVPSGEERSSTLRVRLGITDLLHAYENVGNPLYRVCDSLAAEVAEAHVQIA